MMQLRRFGKRLPVPSTVQIIRELKVLMGADAAHGEALREAAAAEYASEPRDPGTLERRPS